MRFTWFGSKYVRRDCQFVQKAIRSQRLPRIEVRRSKSARPIQSLTRDPSPSNHLPPASGPTVEPIVPATSTPSISVPTHSTSTVSSVPTRYQRPFSSGPRGHTVWYSTESNEPLVSPSSDLPTSAGILYTHKNLTSGATQVWMCDIRRNWIDITIAQGVKHPSLTDRILLLRSDGLPSWLTSANYAAVQARKERR